MSSRRWSSFATFVDSLVEKDQPYSLSAELVADALGLQMQDLAKIAHVHRNTVSSAAESPKMQSAMREILRVLAAASVARGDVRSAITWLRNYPLAEFDYRPPIDVIADGKSSDLIALLSQSSAGVGPKPRDADCAVTVMRRAATG
jgi:hypothetical protein